MPAEVTGVPTLSTKSALEAVMTRVPTVTDLDEDPTTVLSTGDWVVVDADPGLITARSAR